MGLRESYRLPENYNEAYHLTGDGVVVPVVRHIAKYILEPILDCVAKTKNNGGLSTIPCQNAQVDHISFANMRTL